MQYANGLSFFRGVERATARRRAVSELGGDWRGVKLAVSARSVCYIICPNGLFARFFNVFLEKTLTLFFNSEKSFYICTRFFGSACRDERSGSLNERRRVFRNFRVGR